MANLDLGRLGDRRAKRAVSYRLRTLEDYDRLSEKRPDDVQRLVEEALSGSGWPSDQAAEAH